MQEAAPWLERFTTRLTPDTKLVVPTIECGKIEGTMSIRTGLWPSAAKVDRDVPNPEPHMFATDRVSNLFIDFGQAGLAVWDSQPARCC